jgi:phospholipase/lecithinase/hemolysin
LNDTTHFFDYAVGGATTGDMLSIVNTVFLPSKPTLDSDALFVVWGGANDFVSFDQATADNATNNILSILGGLYNQGARHFLVPNMPILGIEPQYAGLTLAEKQAAVLTSIYFDTTLQNQIGNLAYASDVKIFNSADFLIQLALNSSAAGLTNITDACFDGVNVCSTPDSYLFWDNLHPTAYVHALTGIALLAAVDAVPEPSSLALFLTGFILIVVNRRKRTTVQHS